MDVAHLVASWSKDEPGVGAVVVDGLRIINGLGFNGFPRGVEDTNERLKDDTIKTKLIVHAEVNAIMHSRQTRGCTLYTTRYPCSGCTKMIIQSGIDRVVTYGKPTKGKWVEDAEYSELMLSETGIEVILFL